MATHSHPMPIPEDPADFSGKSRRVFLIGAAAGIIGAIAAIALALVDPHPLERFMFAYLLGFGFFLAIGIGALFFVLIQHLTHAGWSVNVRRVAESMAMILPVMGVLVLPILVTVAIQKGTLYYWALPVSAVDAAHHAAPAGDDHAKAAPTGDHADKAKAAAVAHETGRPQKLDELTLSKRKWLNPWFFILRVIVYFGAWSVIALFYWRHSTRQDLDGDVRHTEIMEKYAGVSLLVLGITMTYASFDLLMSLDPHWYSTIFGAYYFSSCAVSFFAAIILAIVLLQKAGYLKLVHKDHYHDLGKYLFGFVFFWGYIAFSQYMLLWYANIPETTTWLARRGCSTWKPTADQVQQAGSYQAALDLGIPDRGYEWTKVSLLLLAGHLLIPFAGLMSRHVKRKRAAIAFWAVWMLVFHYVNMYWIVMPEMRLGLKFSPVDVACWLGIGGIVLAAWARCAGSAKLRPMHDPRVEESIVFTNI